MKSKFSSSWNSSVQPRKQRKFRSNAPQHIRSTKLLRSALSKELKVKSGFRNFRVKLGDTVKVMVGKYAGVEGKVDSVNLDKLKIFVSKVEITKKDGTKVKVPLDPSNVMIVKLDLSDKLRKEKFESKSKKKVN